MRHHRFIGDFDLTQKRLEITDVGLVNQVGNVFRLDAGDEVMLCDGRGSQALSKIAAIDKASLTVDVGQVTPVSTEPRSYVVLYMSLLKRENFELTVEKAVEAGVARIVPVITHRTVPGEAKIERLNKIAREAAEQSGRGVVPEVTAPMKFADAIKDGLANDIKVICDFGGKDIKSIFAQGGGQVSLFIGPEGGWDQEESTAARAAGYQAADLGALTLRAETAAIVATWLASR